MRGELDVGKWVVILTAFLLWFVSELWGVCWLMIPVKVLITDRRVLIEKKIIFSFLITCRVVEPCS